MAMLTEKHHFSYSDGLLLNVRYILQLNGHIEVLEQTS